MPEPSAGLTTRSSISTQQTARGQLEALRRIATAPAGRQGVKAVVGRRLALYPPTEMTAGEWASWWADYYDALEDVPFPALEAGMAAWVRKPDSRFMPKPGELRYLAQTTENAAELAYERELREAQRQHQLFSDAQTVRVAPPTPEEIAMREDQMKAGQAAVKNMLDEFLAAHHMRDEETAAKRPKLRPIQARIDETGVSPELRRIVHSQRF